MIIHIKPQQHLRQLNQFDRFCFANEKHKRKVWQVVQHLIVDVQGERKLMTRCINDKFEMKRFDGNRVVVFLRSADPAAYKCRLKQKRNRTDELISD